MNLLNTARVAHDTVLVATEDELELESMKVWSLRAGLKLRQGSLLEGSFPTAGEAPILIQIVEWPRGLDSRELVLRLGRSNAATTLLIIPEDVEADFGAQGIPDDWDFVQRPFDRRELVWRADRALSRLMRRESGVVSAPALVRGPLSVDPATGEVRVNGLALALRRAERDVLVYLMRQAPRCITAEELQREVLHSHGNGGAARNQIYELRRKLRAAGFAEAIVSRCCDGYRLIWTD